MAEQKPKLSRLGPNARKWAGVLRNANFSRGEGREEALFLGPTLSKIGRCSPLGMSLRHTHAENKSAQPVGLINGNNVCGINTMVHLIASSACLVSAIRSGNSDAAHVARLTPQSRLILGALVQAITETSGSSRAVDLCAVVWSLGFQMGAQLEFQALLDAVLPGLQLQCTQISLATVLVCRAGHKTGSGTEVTSTLTVPIPQSWLQQSCYRFEGHDVFLLKNDVGREYTLSQAVQAYLQGGALNGCVTRCGTCHGEVVAASHQIICAPEVLVVSIQRGHNFGGRHLPIKGNLSIGEHLSFGDQLYKLTATGLHTGTSVHAGHFTCYRRQGTQVRPVCAVAVIHQS